MMEVKSIVIGADHVFIDSLKPVRAGHGRY
jgi:hypothetical protein